MRPASLFIRFAIRAVSLGLFICLAHLKADAADAARDYLTDVWTSEKGLPDNSVTAITQTPDGYLWIGTFNGLVRFDGVRFVTFDPANTPALLHAHVRHLYVDSQGTLWINTYDGSLTTYRQGQFVLERRNTHLAEGEMTLVSSSPDEIVFLTSRGALLSKTLSSPPEQGWEEVTGPHRGLGALCCEDGHGTLWYRDVDGHLWQVTAGKFTPMPDTDPLAGTNVLCLTADTNGRLWVGTGNGLAFWDDHKFQDATPTNSDLRPRITALSVMPDGHIWAVANGCVCEAAGRRWILAPDPTRYFFADTSDPVGMQQDHQGGMWFYNHSRGLVHVLAVGDVHPLTAADDFPDAQVYCGFDDREGDLWMGLDAGGLVRLREAQFHTANPDDQKAAESVSQDAQGAIWIGLMNGGLDRLDNGTFTNLTAPDQTASGAANCVCPDNAGRLWVSGSDDNLYVRAGNRFELVQPLIHRVKAILTARNGRVWVGTTSGLYFTDGGPEQIQFFKGMERHSVRALAEDSAGTLWAGSGNGDLYHIVNDTATVLDPGGDQEADAVWSVLADDDGTVWAGTFRGGLLRFRDGKFTRYGKAQGLPDNVICQILDDGRGNLWIGSHQGVFRVAKSALDDVASGKNIFVTCVAYGRSDGLPSLECSGGFQPSAWRDTDGRLWFTTDRGAAWIQPEEVHPNLTPPPVVIEEVLVDGQIQTNHSEGENPPALEVPPGKHLVEIHYTGLSLVSPERVQFRYRLEDVSAAWIEAGTQRFAQYSFLPPGHYHFHVLACNSDGVWNRTGAVLALDILPHFYQTWWFQSFAVLVILGIVAGTVRQIATRKLRLRMEQLERHKAVELERSRIAKDIHDDLGASLTLIAVLGDLAKKEKTAERIEKMSGTAREAVKSLDEIVWAVNPRNDTLTHLVDYTGQFATGYLRDAGIRCLLDVPEHLPAREVPANVRHNLFLVVKETLQNIVKHARATTVWLRVNADERGLTIGVEDNGCGFDRADGDPWANGLRNMRQRLAEIGGDCRIQSHPGSGTTITVELPFPKN